MIRKNCLYRIKVNKITKSTCSGKGHPLLPCPQDMDKRDVRNKGKTTVDGLIEISVKNEL